MLKILLWMTLPGISVGIGCWRDLTSTQRTPGGLAGWILCAFLGGWCAQTMFWILLSRWWFALLLQAIGAFLLTFFFGRIRWELYEGGAGR